MTIKCPEAFCLEANFEGVVDVLHGIRSRSERQKNEHTYIDFRQIRRLSPSAALVLAAELDRWNVVRPKYRIRTTDVEDCDPTIRRLLDDMGCFDLLHAGSPRAIEARSDDETSYVKFRSGQRGDGEAIRGLRTDDLEPVVGAIPRTHDLYAAVSEAMTNVAQHAYKGGKTPPQCAKWWLSASRNAATSEVCVMVYDQGVGIPETLPRKFAGRVNNMARTDHARMIEAAHELKRTSIGEPHRGHGLERDIRGYLDVLDRPATYRVMSLKGEYVYERGSDGRRDRPLISKSRSQSHAKPLYGTLIEWRLTLK